MPIGAIIGAGASLLGGFMSSDSAGDAADAQAAAAAEAARVQKEMYDQSRTDMMPYMGRGYQGLDLYAMNLGIMPPGSRYTAEGFSYVNPDGSVVGPENPPQGYFPTHESVGGTGALAGMSQGGSQFMGDDQRYGHFFSSPAYSQTYNAGLDQIDQSSAMKGMNLSGNQAGAAANYGAGNASQRWNDYMNQLAQLSNVGGTSANSMTELGSKMGTNLANQALYAGDARASGYAGQGSAWANTMNQLGTQAGRYFA